MKATPSATMRVETSAGSAPGVARPRRLAGLLVRRECWCLSRRGWIVAVGAALAGGWMALHGACAFLSPTVRVPARFLVVEGWIPAYAVDEAAREFRAGSYEKVFTTGGPMKFGVDLEPADNYAEQGAARLRRFGIEPARIQAVPAPPADYDRTFTAALALRRWCETNGVPIQACNVVTLGPHARRSRLMYEKAFGGTAVVGVISLRDHEYDPARWWRYSEGVKEVLSESFAYLYARLWFRPAPAGS